MQNLDDLDYNEIESKFAKLRFSKFKPKYLERFARIFIEKSEETYRKIDCSVQEKRSKIIALLRRALEINPFNNFINREIFIKLQ